MATRSTKKTKHVFGSITGDKGATLCYTTAWGKKLELALTDVLENRSEDCDTTVEIFGSIYDLSYRKTDAVECITVREQQLSQRPLGKREAGPQVTQLHFYRSSSSKEWQLMESDDEIFALATAEPIAA